LAPEISNNYPNVRQLLVENFQVWCGAIEGLIQEASDRLPAETRPAALAQLVLATMEGAAMLARANRSLEPFDQAVTQLKDYFERLLRDRAESDTKRAGGGKAKKKSK
jgi:hypothetical protein